MFFAPMSPHPRELPPPQGYVLDGFPRSLDEARALFLTANAQHPSVAGADDPVAALAAVPPPLPEHDFQPALYKPHAFAPTHVVALQCSAEQAEARFRALSAAAVIAGHNDDEGCKRRWETYATRGDAQCEQSPLHFFTASIECATIDTTGAPAAAAAAAAGAEGSAAAASTAETDAETEAAIAGVLAKANAYLVSGARENFHPTPAERAELARQQRVAEVQRQAREAHDVRLREDTDAREREQRLVRNDDALSDELRGCPH